MTQPADPVQSFVKISIEQVYSEVRTIHDALQRIESTLASMRDLEPRLRDLEKLRLQEQVPDHEARLRALEDRRIPHSVMTVFAGVVGTAALVWQGILMLMK